ncbi:hypothetical protein [Symbioplanes lichenis]|uniref:hypothetical protein n=1 Tax=Symbioplanes lichenis TaxID=1629072 RepID=UPI002738B008|nr:hypothetical protein [Actinoplanes lichenis]
MKRLALALMPLSAIAAAFSIAATPPAATPAPQPDDVSLVIDLPGATAGTSAGTDVSASWHHSSGDC